MGTTRADGEGTVEKGHPAVHQWNYCVGNSDFTMSVGYKDQNNMENVNHKAGDWSFIPAGADHDLVSEPGKEVYYVWFEHFTDEKKFAKPEINICEGRDMKRYQYPCLFSFLNAAL